MGTKIYEIRNELNRVANILDEAEKTGKILVHAECGDQRNTKKPDDPYPIFYTAKELMSEINNGSWHYVNWYLEDRDVMKKQILERINDLQQRLIRL